jgi:subfamily B ATP-binding cassette protein MsbA
MFETLTATADPLRRLFRAIRPSKTRSVLSVVLLFIGGGLEGVTVGLLVPILETFTGTANPTPGPFQAVLNPLLAGLPPGKRVLALGVALVVLVATKNLVSYAGVSLAGRLRSRAMVELRQQLVRRLLRAPPALLERHTSGEITSVLVTEASRVSRALDLTVSLTHRGIIALSYLVALLFLSWQLTAITALLGIALGIISQALGRAVLRHGRQFTRANADLSRRVTEVVGGLRTIRTTAGEAVHERGFERDNRALSNADVGASKSQAFSTGAIETLGIAGAMALTALAHQFWLSKGTLDVPSFLAFGFGLLRLLPALNQLYAGQGFLTQLVGGVEQVLKWLDLPTYPARPFGSAPVPKLNDGIRFDQVSFGYSAESNVLRSLSFVLPVGETLAVVGSSGSGKSTLASLLLRLREPTAGRILFDGVEHWEFDQEDFHRTVAFVDQDCFVFNASILENVTCGAPDITREQVIDALRLVKLDSLIEQTPDGVDTLVAERGATLSGGQRQRLAIARAIVRNPQILVLDEPTSALDAETEREVVGAIDAASVGRTTIIITHRESTVRHARVRLSMPSGELKTTVADARSA